MDSLYRIMKSGGDTVKTYLLPMLKRLAVTAPVAFLLVLGLGLPATLIVSLFGGSTDIPMFIALALSWPLAFYIVYARRQSEAAAKDFTDRFHPIANMKRYLRGEGKYLLCLYLLAALLAIACRESEALRGVTFALYAVFPLGLISLYAAWPLLLSLPLTAALSLLLVSLAHYRAWRVWYVEDHRLSDRDLENANTRRRILYSSFGRIDRKRHK